MRCKKCGWPTLVLVEEALVCGTVGLGRVHNVCSRDLRRKGRRKESGTEVGRRWARLHRNHEKKMEPNELWKQARIFQNVCKRGVI